LKFKELIQKRSELTKQLRKVDRQIYNTIRAEHERRYCEALKSDNPPLSNWVTDFENKYAKGRKRVNDAEVTARYETIVASLLNSDN
ncbi:MAG: hypothetical protein ACP5D6_11430, partial [Kosmotogaceae bacterium]